MPKTALSSADAATLVELRRRLSIRIGQAGVHAQSLLQLTAAGILTLGIQSCDDVLAEEITDAQYVLGFKPDADAGLDGKRRATAPSWVWEPGQAADLLREFEGRTKSAIDWDDFVRWVLGVWEARRTPTIREAAERFELSVLDVVDQVDQYRWAYRVCSTARSSTVERLGRAHQSIDCGFGPRALVVSKPPIWGGVWTRMH